MNEKEIVASSYLYTFYLDVQELNSAYSNYANFLDYLNAKYHNYQAEKGIDEQDNAALRNLVTKLRFFIHKTYMEFKTVTSIAKSDMDIEPAYTQLRTSTFIPNFETTNQFVICINRYILQDGIKQLMQTSASLVAQIFSNDTEKQTTTDN